MASRYWVGGSATWNATAGTKWATSSGGAGGAAVPTSSDNVFLDANSGAVTVTIDNTAAVTCSSFDCTGFTGTLDGNSTGYYMNVRGATFKLVSGMSVTNSLPVQIDASSCQVTTAGKTLFTMNSSGSGTGLILQDDLTCTGGIGTTSGTYNFNNKNVTCPTFSVAANCSASFGSGTLTLTGSGTVMSVSTSNTTISATTGTIKITDSSATTKTFAGAGKVYGNVWVTGGTGSFNFTGANTFANFRADTGSILKFTASTTTTFTSATLGTGLTITSITSAVHTLSCAAGAVQAIGATISYSTATGGASFFALGGTNSGNNTGWQFVAARWWVGGAGTWDASSTINWAASSGGAGGSSVPNSAIAVLFDANSGGAAVSLYSNDAECHLLDCTGFTGSLTGSVKTNSNVTIAGGMTATSLLLDLRNSGTLTTNGKTLYQITVSFGTTTLGGALTLAGQLANYGTFNAANYAVTVGSFYNSDKTGAGVVQMGTNTWSLTGTGTVWESLTGTTVTPSTSTIKLTDVSGTTKQIYGGGKAYYNLWLTGSGPCSFEVYGSNTFTDIKMNDAGIDQTLKFEAGTTNTVTTFTVTGYSGYLKTIGSVTAAPHTLTKSGGGVIDCDYMSISQSAAGPASTWYAGTHSTQGANVTGWVFNTSTGGGSAALIMGGMF